VKGVRARVYVVLPAVLTAGIAVLLLLGWFDWAWWVRWSVLGLFLLVATRVIAPGPFYAGDALPPLRGHRGRTAR